MLHNAWVFGTSSTREWQGRSEAVEQTLRLLERAMPNMLLVLRPGIEQLSRTDREILTLRHALRYDAEQIADFLGINAAAKARLSRAGRRL
jgi:DNA-directed RNA polymerase specialized sigma24 family protein